MSYQQVFEENRTRNERTNGLGWFGQLPAPPAPAPPTPAAVPPPHPAIAALCLSSPRTQPTVTNALAIVRLISQFHTIPWRVPFIVLEHEGGVRLFGHHDGVMQTIDSAKTATIRAMPRELKLGIVGRAYDDTIAIAALNAEVRAQFPQRLAVQIACGIQELKNGLDRFAGYVALALIAYNAGAGNAARVVTRGASSGRPAGTTDPQWEQMCRTAAALYHQLPSAVRIATGQWQCDANIPAWFQHIAVFDQPSGIQLIAYQYLRQINSCIPPVRPATACVPAIQGQRKAGTGVLVCNPTRFGALDKLYNPTLLGGPYRAALTATVGAIPADTLPIQVQNGRLVKIATGAGPAIPQGNPFDGMI